MKAQVLTGTAQESVSRIRLSTLILGSLVMVLLFSIVYIRQMSIKTGYEISALIQKKERTEIEYMSLVSKKAEAYDSEHLYEKAKRIGMTIPDVKRTFYVKE